MDNSGDISAMIGKIMADPAFAEMVERLKGDNTSSAEDAAAKMPDIMAAIAPMLSGINGGSGSQKQNAEAGPEKGAEGEKEKRGPEKSQPTPRKHDKAQAEKLLYALKPYLNPNRCAIIDKCVSVMQLTDIVSAFGGIEGLLKTAGR